MIDQTNQRLDDLNIGGLRIFQDPSGFCFGTDAIALSDFVTLYPGETAIDLCTGSGILPLLLYAKTPCRNFIGVELQPAMAQMAQRSVALNGLCDVIRIIQGDIKQITKFGLSKCHVITCNPPYLPCGSGAQNPLDAKAAARHEIFCTIDDIAQAMSKILRHGGRYYMVHRCDRLTDVLCALRQYHLEPKQLCFLHSDYSKGAKLFLVNGILGGGKGLKILPPRLLKP